ncbi:MAG: beta-ketoacyl-ACP synthase [Moraxellaceae bacterium]|nr:beta-ketoacyl-ACP synthase [Moraxellaceae bacterium]
MKRVVVTGMAGITSLGHDWDSIANAVIEKRNGICRMDEWDIYADLNTRLGAPVHDFTVPAHFTRKKTRSMGRVALMSTVAAEKSLRDAGLLEHPVLKSGHTGIAFGSSTGSTDAIRDFGSMLINHDARGINATSYIRMMSHTAAVNVALYFGLRGRTLPTSSACTSGSMAIGQAYEAIKYGKQAVMLAGGAEELCASEAAVFDTMFATSTRNDTPHLSPRPYDKDRDGLVIGEGAGCIILEELEHARARGAHIHAELVGYGTNSDGAHVTRPEADTMGIAMQLALEDAGLPPTAIGYVNGHGTATDQGDVAETQATRHILGHTPISSLKSYFGHTLGACGAVESWLSIEMMNRDWYIPTLNLTTVDDRCGDLDYLQGEPRRMQHEYVMNNNFAFGGINTSLIFKRYAA